VGDYDAGIPGRQVSLLGVLVGTEVPLWLPLLSVITLGTLAPYGIDVAALQHLPPTTGHP
jgi:hypothetical protein